MKSPIFSLAALALAAGTLSVTAQEWARFRGPGGSGLSEAKGIPVEIGPEQLLWGTKLPGTGHSSPVLWGDTVFLTATLDDGKRALIAYAAADGAEKWRSEYPFTAYQQHKFNDFASSTPCVDAERVYCTWTSPEGVDVIAVDHKGETAWEKRVGKFYAKHGSAASPVLAGGHLLVGSLGEKGDSFIVGLDPASGDEKWRLARDSNEKGAYSTPVERTGSDGLLEVIYSSTAHGLTAVDPKTGKVRWEYDTDFNQRCVSAPVVAGDTIFASAGSGGGGKESAVIKLVDGNPEAAWEASRKGLPYVPTGIAANGLMFLLNDGGIMTCMRADDGEVLWQERAVEAPYASPIIIGDKIYCCSKEGHLSVLEAGDQFKPLGTHKFPAGIYATPAVAGGKLYIRTFERLYCIGE